MHRVTLSMDRVFDLQPDCFSGNMRRTLFSFESNGKRYLSVLVDGAPDLQSGQTITAVLERPDDWQTVLGLRIHESGEICAPDTTSYCWPLLVTGVAATVAYWQLAFRNSYALVLVLAGLFLMAGFFLHKMWISAKIRKALWS